MDFASISGRLACSFLSGTTKQVVDTGFQHMRSLDVAMQVMRHHSISPFVRFTHLHSKSPF